ncbi:hypothetical protein [Peribacillus sp. TH14]|uniref:hypothetical protein n=1 Tax=Peribacillus sp. TH14 TaxID=2798481 RepID=UPI001A93805C|nr:hypothetical protein [Peribacillus sp. TH14]
MKIEGYSMTLREREKERVTVYIIWVALAIMLFFIAFEFGVSFWLNSETDKEMSKSKEMIHTIRAKLVRKSAS